MKAASRKTKLGIPNRQGISLSAQLECWEKEPVAFAVFANCFTCTKDYKAVSWSSARLAQKGFGVVTFDFTGLGESGGDFPETNLSTMVEDLASVADFLKKEHRAPQLMIGYSLGGVAVLAAAPQIPELSAVATLATTSRLDSFRTRLVEEAPDILSKGEGFIETGGTQFNLKRQFFDDLEKYNALSLVGQLGKSLLIIHSRQDEVVPFEQAEELYARAQEPKTLSPLKGVPHLLLKRQEIHHVADLIAGWAKSHISGLGL